MSAEMADPLPENIDGAKTVTYSHEVHHRINWGYVAIGAAVIAAVLLARSRLEENNDEDGRLG